MFKADAWIMHRFKHPSRPEKEPILSHWSKANELDDVYPFSKFNKRAKVIKISEDEFKTVVQGLSRDNRKVLWSKQDTKLLFQLCEDFDLKFVPITDRFNFEKHDEMRRLDQKNSKRFNVAQNSKRVRKCKEKEVKKIQEKQANQP